VRPLATGKIAWRALRRNPMRSALTALGIVVGVAAVIAMVAIGNGAKAQVEAQIASLGQNVVQVFSGSTTSSGLRRPGPAPHGRGHGGHRAEIQVPASAPKSNVTQVVSSTRTGPPRCRVAGLFLDPPMGAG
jgi:ABC-type lipoprotein release transport system permease subunit